MAARTLRVNIVGDSSGAQKALGAVSSQVGATATGMGRARAALSGVSSAVTGVASTVANFATSGADDFANWAGQVVSVQKVMGGTTEDASRLAYQAKILGVDSQALATGMRFLSKDVAGGGKGLAALGISTKDAQGHIKSMPDLLKEVSAKVQSIPPGAQRTAAILKIFGKQGMALTPILGASASQMGDLGKESDQLGYTLDGKATASVKTHAQEQRRLQAAFGAVKIQIGQALMPVLTDLGKAFAEKIVPIIKDVVKWTKDHEGIVKVLVIGLGAFVVALKAINAGMAAYRAIMLIVRGVTIAYTAVQWLLNVAMTANPIGLIIVGIAALIAIFVLLWKKCAWFRDFWKAVWNFIKDHFKTILLIIGSIMTGGLLYLATHWRQVWDGIKWFFVTIWNFIREHFKTIMTIVLSIMTGGLFLLVTHWRDVWNGIKGFFVAIWDGIKTAFKAAVDWVKDRAEGFVNFWRDLPGKIGRFFTGMWDGLKDGFKAAINFIIGIWNHVADGLSFTVPDWVPGIGGDTFGLPHIHELAKGGTLMGGGLALVGEKGPELLGLPGGSSVIPLPRATGGGNTYVVNINVAGSVRADQDLAKTITPILRDELVRLAKRNGGQNRLAPA